MKLIQRNPQFIGHLFGQQAQLGAMAPVHDKGEFPIKGLPHWQQEIMLKAVNKVPELRFQSMADFAEAMKAKQVPHLLNETLLKPPSLSKKSRNPSRRKNGSGPVHSWNLRPRNTLVM